ncbi:hypothetical protein P7K49_014899, partial [Saguinus oedipus]
MPHSYGVGPEEPAYPEAACPAPQAQMPASLPAVLVASSSPAGSLTKGCTQFLKEFRPQEDVVVQKSHRRAKQNLASTMSSVFLRK